MELRFLGHACFLLDDGAHHLLTDPYPSGNPQAAADPEKVEADFIFLSHGHHDHVGDTVAIARRTGATVCCVADLYNAVLASSGVQVIAGNLGGRVKLPFGSAKFIPALHGGGAAGCPACGFLFEIGGKKIYYAGDTALTLDMQLLAEEQVDVALLPIGDFYTMGPEDALRAARMIRPKLVIPMHYNTFPVIIQDPEAFAASVLAAGMQARVLQPGESLSLEDLP